MASSSTNSFFTLSFKEQSHKGIFIKQGRNKFYLDKEVVGLDDEEEDDDNNSWDSHYSKQEEISCFPIATMAVTMAKTVTTTTLNTVKPISLLTKLFEQEKNNELLALRRCQTKHQRLDEWFNNRHSTA